MFVEGRVFIPLTKTVRLYGIAVEVSLKNSRYVLPTPVREITLLALSSALMQVGLAFEIGALPKRQV